MSSTIRSARPNDIKQASKYLPVLPLRDAVYFPGTQNALLVAREASCRAIRKATGLEGSVIVVSQRDMNVDDPAAKDLYSVGVMATILQPLPLPDGSLRVTLRCESRVRISRISHKGGYLSAEFSELSDDTPMTSNTIALSRKVVESLCALTEHQNFIDTETAQRISHIENPSLLADAIGHHLPIRPTQKQDLLEKLNVDARLENILVHLKEELLIIQAKAEIDQRVSQAIGGSQRDFYLREQLRIISNELKQAGDRSNDYDLYARRIQDGNLPPSIQEKAESELLRLKTTPDSSPEALVIRNYIDALLGLPWGKNAPTSLDLIQIEGVLEENHYGLNEAKEHILDWAATAILQGSPAFRPLCLVGPPGVGKTSFAQSIARALGKPFARLALGGMRDEAEIRGHRRTYVAASPGKLAKALAWSEVSNPVILLDEIDKVGFEGKGDPASALLEALDPEQNRSFSDNFLEVGLDLSEVVFIATANALEPLPSALRDRFDVIWFDAYSDAEKLVLGKNFLLPRALHAHGITESQMILTDEIMRKIIEEYTFEAGTRGLSRRLEGMARKAARRIVTGKSGPYTVTEPDLKSWFGSSISTRPAINAQTGIGQSWGLVVSEAGGQAILIEAVVNSPNGNRADLQLTGSLGEVLKESVLAALTFLRTAIPEANKLHDIHLHIPAGGVPKDGPSGGIPIAIALASSFLKKPIPAGIAMTGEISLSGNVLRIGGLKEKIIAAQRARAKVVIYPTENEGDFCDLPDEIKQSMKFVPVKSLIQVLGYVGLVNPENRIQNKRA